MYNTPYKALQAAPTDPHAITILESQNKGWLTKHFKLQSDGSYSVKSAIKVSYFRVKTVHVGSIHGFRALLASIQHDPCRALISGALLPTANSDWTRRLLRGDDKNPATFADTSRCLMAFDFDGTPCPNDLNMRDLPAVARHLRSLLPLPFADVTCVFQASGSYLVKPGIHAHAWFYLDAPLTCAQMRTWMERDGNGVVDPAIYNAIQITYVARPIFDRQKWDPFAGGGRAVLISGARNTVPTPPASELVRASHSAGDSGGGSKQPLPRNAAVAIAKKLTAVHKAPDGQRHKALLSAAMLITAYVAQGRLDGQRALSSILNAGWSVGKGEKEIQKIWQWALDRAAESESDPVAEAALETSAKDELEFQQLVRGDSNVQDDT